MTVSPLFPQPTCDECRQLPNYHTIKRTEWRHKQTGKPMKAHGFRMFGGN